MMMKKKFAFLFVAMGLFMFASCSSEDSSNTQEATQIETEAEVPPMNYGDEGPVYCNDSGEAVVQVLSMDEKELSIRLLDRDMILELQRVEGEGIVYKDMNQNMTTFESEEYQTMTVLYADGAEQPIELQLRNGNAVVAE